MYFFLGLRGPITVVHRYEAALESCLGRCDVSEGLDLLILLFLSLYSAIWWLKIESEEN